MEINIRRSVENGSTSLLREAARLDFVEGVSPSTRGVEAVIRKVAQSEVPVLLLAERGVGKKATARRIHDLSRRARQTFRVIPCAHFGATNFTEVAGSTGFTGTGTVFLEELADLKPEAQEWLLQAVIEGNENGSRGEGFSRLVCGSARDLEAEMSAGNFREDLYYRVSGVCLRLPPLRQRREDIPVLMEHFLRKYSRDFQRPVPALSEETHRLFLEYSWPGNVQELENAAKALVALGDEQVAMGGLRAMLVRADAGGNGNRVSLKDASRAASREAEKEIILRVLTRTRWNRRRAAQELQISYKALLYKLKQMGCTEYGAT